MTQNFHEKCPACKGACAELLNFYEGENHINDELHCHDCGYSEKRRFIEEKSQAEILGIIAEAREFLYGIAIPLHESMKPYKDIYQSGFDAALVYIKQRILEGE